MGPGGGVPQIATPNKPFGWQGLRLSKRGKKRLPGQSGGWLGASDSGTNGLSAQESRGPPAEGFSCYELVSVVGEEGRCPLKILGGLDVDVCRRGVRMPDISLDAVAGATVLVSLGDERAAHGVGGEVARELLPE